MNKGIVTRREQVAVGEEVIAADLTYSNNEGFERFAVLVHGGPGGVKEGPVALYVDIAEHLAGQGIASVRFDFLGVGESSGAYENMTITRQAVELDAVIDHISEKYSPHHVALVGESYGATASILALRRDRYSCLVLLWPAIWLLEKTFAPYVTPEKLALARTQGYIEEEGERIGLTFLEEVLQISDVSSGLAGTLVPVLFVHGEADQEVPFQQSVRAAELVTGPQRVVLVPGGDHCLERPSERLLVHREVSGWLTTHLSHSGR